MDKTICSSSRLSSENSHMPFYELLVQRPILLKTPQTLVPGHREIKLDQS